MSQKTRNRYIYWSDDSSEDAESVVRKYGELMRLNGIQPMTTKNAKREEQVNVSGVIAFSLMVASGRIKLPE